MYRYGHPNDRPIYTSAIPPNVFQEIVVSYFTHAYTHNNGDDESHTQSKREWTWREIHTFNKGVDWSKWKYYCA